MADLENSSELLRQSLDELRKTGTLTTATLDKLNAATKKSINGVKDLGETSKQSAGDVDNFGKTLTKVTRALIDSTGAIRENREDFRSLNPAIRASGIAVGAAGRKLGDAMSGVGDAISGLSLFLGPKGKLVGILGGSLLSGLGKAVGASSDAAAQLAVQFGEFATGELQNVVNAYREVGSVGAISAGGMTQLYDQAIAAGLSIGQFGKIVANNSETLAKATGSTAEGAKVLAQISKVGDATQRQFLALGISVEQTREFQAKFLEQNRLTGRIAINDTKALTEASKAYLFQLDELARITGLSREQAQKLLDEQNRNIRFRASVRMAEREFGPQVAQAMRDSAAVLRTANKEIGEGFEDLMGPGGASTEAARNLMIATGGAAKGIADMVRTGQLTADQGAAMIRQAIKNKMEGLGGDQYLAFVGKVEGPLQNMLLGMDDVAQSNNLTVEAMKAARQSSVDARKAEDKNTQQIIDAQLALQKMAVELDKIVKEKILPHAATAVRQFTETLLKSVEYINEKLGIGKATGGGGGGPSATAGPAFAPPQQRPQAIGQPGPAPSDDYLKKVMQLESGGRNIGNQPVAGRAATSAHGLFQITKGTFEGIVANAPPDSKLKGKTFEDMKGDTDLQTEAMKLLTQENARRLGQAGLSTSDAAKYMAHMLGYGGASRVLGANANTPISRLLSQEAIANNKLERFVTAGQLRAEFDRRTGGGGYQYGGIASGPRSGYMSMLHGTEAVIPLPGGRSIPVEMTGMTDKMGQQVGMMGAQLDRLDELINLMKTNNDVSTKILRATQS